MSVETKYTIGHRGGCVMVYGAFPIRALSALVELVDNPRKALMATTLARMMDATVAFGSPEDVADLVAELTPGAIATWKQKIHGLGLPEGSAEWLAIGEQGASSCAMFQTLTGYQLDAEGAAPSDPSDLRRCLLLFEAVPDLRKNLAAMNTVSGTWAALVARWDDLVKTLDAEAPEWREPTKKTKWGNTYDLMQTIIESAE